MEVQRKGQWKEAFEKTIADIDSLEIGLVLRRSRRLFVAPCYVFWLVMTISLMQGVVWKSWMVLEERWEPIRATQCLLYEQARYMQS
jgi:hypothetical protein